MVAIDKSKKRGKDKTSWKERSFRVWLRVTESYKVCVLVWVGVRVRGDKETERKLSFNHSCHIVPVWV